ncbi:hypothetical protein [Kibdelosporangium aridum]|uniref:hypothetical protein n=1 Tax=Kibdelosporangium aridum TaxID=2030 RepID=UPI00052743F1
MDAQNLPEIPPERADGVAHSLTEPDEVLELSGIPTARWGQGVISYDEEPDRIPAVYASGFRSGEIDTGEFRGSLDEAERYAERIVTAVRWWRAQGGELR